MSGNHRSARYVEVAEVLMGVRLLIGAGVVVTVGVTGCGSGAATTILAA